MLRAETGGRGERHRVRRVTLGSGERIDCDLLVTAAGWTAPTTLLNLAGDRPVYSSVAARFLPGGLAHPSVLATGGLAGDGSLEVLIEHGRATGREAASRAGRGTSVAIPELPVIAHPPLFRSRTHGMVDFSEDVSSKDVVDAAAEGFDSIELVKRFTTATMGPAQGKLETVNLVAVLAEANGSVDRDHRDDRVAPAVRADHARRPGRARVRAGPLLADAAVARRPQSAAPRRRCLDPTGPLRRPRGGGAQRAGARRDHRRDAARQARPARSRRRRGAQPAVRQPVEQARRGRRPVRRDVRRRRCRPR